MNLCHIQGQNDSAKFHDNKTFKEDHSWLSLAINGETDERM